MEEHVILVDEKDNEIGTALKDTVHTNNTPLHRAFSLFLFNSKNEILLTKRAKNKKTFPGVWTNTACGHPAPGEDVIEAILRRLEAELGLTRSHLVGFTEQGETLIREVSAYRYRFVDANGIVENEICPIFVAYANIDPKPDPKEVDAWKWVEWSEFLRIKDDPNENFSPWCREEAGIIAPLI
ncbi:MAG: isopentenyl-diphosphate Delta-isomerase [Patescibacteria group bacterium]